jgi:Family of unknown function (DUF5681)
MKTKWEIDMPRKEKSDYEVGYCRPPTAHQFKKGQSGNPRGRRKGSISAASHVAKALNESVFVQDKGQRRSLSKMAVAATQLVNKAVSGDLRAWKYLFTIMETLEWKKLIETVEPGANGEDPMEIVRRQLDLIHARLAANREPPEDQRPG